MSERKRYDVRYVYGRAKHYLWCSTHNARPPEKYYSLSAFARQRDSLTSRQICRLAVQQQNCMTERLLDKVLAAAAFVLCLVSLVGLTA